MKTEIGKLTNLGAVKKFYGWKLANLDISDTYLTVAQQEICHVKISGWIEQLLGLPSNALWQLRRFLPGQRNGAQR